MPLNLDLSAEVKKIIREAWDVVETTDVPEPKDVKLNTNQAKHLESATVLYADIDGSTNMVQSRSWSFSAEVYKSFLMCAAEIIRSENGVITAYDGDRVMGLFVDDFDKNTRSVRAALKICKAVRDVIDPAIRAVYTHLPNYEVKHVVGIDTSEVRAARTGVRGDNDLVWIGRAPNFAAKLTDLSIGFRTIITSSVYDRLNDSARIGSDKRNMWTPYTWNAMGDMRIYASNYQWSEV